MAALKHISGIVICFFAILLMSHNVSAIDLTNNVQIITANFPSQFYLTHVNNSNCAISMPTGTWLDRLACTTGYIRVHNVSVSIPPRTYNSGDWVIIEFSTTAGGVSYSNHFQSYGWRYVGSNPVDLISVEQSSASVSTGTIRLYMRFYNTVYTNALDFGGIGSQPIFEVSGQNQEAAGAIRINPISVWQEIRSNPQNYSQSLNNINNSLNDLKNQKEQEKQEVQNQTQNSQNVGANSSSDATNATTSLISVIGGFVSAVTSATPSDCKIDAYTPHFDMGELDLCANPVPSYIQIIGSIILICAVIPFAIILFNKFIGLFRSFQG